MIGGAACRSLRFISRPELSTLIKIPRENPNSLIGRIRMYQHPKQL
jgi:hypothetical protein